MSHRRRPVLLWLPRYRRRPPEDRRPTRPENFCPLKEYWHRLQNLVWVIGRLAPPKPALPARADRQEDEGSVWSALASYGLVTVLALLILSVTDKPSPRVLPTVGPISHTPRPRALSQWFRAFHIGTPSVRDWFIDGVPLVAWVQGNLPNPWTVHWRSLSAAAVSAVTGTPLTSLSGLMVSAVPAMSVAPLPAVSEAPPAELERKEAGLPGDNGRVWAVLGQDPVVGIYHTHTHESFTSVTGASADPYSTDWSKTIVQVGWWLAQDLNGYGLGVVQSRVDNMSQGMLASYGLSLRTAKDLLRWWPSVRVLLDIHRGNAALDQTLTTIHGAKTAKILIVVGTNQLLPNPHWHENLEFALKLSQELKAIAPGILRGNGIDTVPYRYNQQLLPADLLVEIGGPDNTLEQERRAASELAAALADMIRTKQIPDPTAPIH